MKSEAEIMQPRWVRWWRRSGGLRSRSANPHKVVSVSPSDLAHAAHSQNNAAPLQRQPARSRLGKLVAAAVGILLALPVVVLAGNRFTDVPDGHWAHNEINLIASRAITQGCGSGQFCPNITVTRDQMAVFMSRMLALDLAETRYSYAAFDGGRGTCTYPCSGLYVRGASGATAFIAESDRGAGVLAQSTSATAVDGISTSANGVRGYSTSAAGVSGSSMEASGVDGYGSRFHGVRGITGAGGTPAGVLGESVGTNGNGVVGEANNGASAYGVWGRSTSGYAGYFNGQVHVSGTLSKSAGAFKIDHPLDPGNKYLSHSFVESPDMKNVYDGNVTTDKNGDATVILPDYFEALNRDFRYQLTVIGQFAQAIVASEIKDNRFTIKTDKPNVKVSWQVTGIRQDAYAQAHPIKVEEDKPAAERDHYLHPELHGRPNTKSVDRARKAGPQP